MDGTLIQVRFRMMLLGLFSVMALAIAATGLYGVMAYMVGQRTKEIGVRVALGAQSGQILSELRGAGARLTIAGALAGIGIAAMVTRYVATLLYGVRSFDTATYLAAASLLIAVAFLACVIPGRRATAIDPVQAAAGVAKTAGPLLTVTDLQNKYFHL